MLKENLIKMKKSLTKYRKVVITILIIYAFWFFGLGILGGWLISKGSISSFPDITDKDSILIIAPHIDDEVIATGGLIQEVVAKKAKVRVVYMTNGDDNVNSIFSRDKNLNLDPNEFISLGESRMKEGEEATKVLGLEKKDIIFLGYPDQGLELMLNGYYNKPLASHGTKFNYNPYSGTYKEKQEYTGENVTKNLSEIIENFKPTIVVVSHPRDKHPDHRASYGFLEKTFTENKSDFKIYTYLVHFTLYPAEKKFQKYSFMFPPKKLFTKEGWYSYDLYGDQQDKKIEALEKNQSQIKNMDLNGAGNFLKSFVRKNEIFELMN